MLVRLKRLTDLMNATRGIYKAALQHHGNFLLLLLERHDRFLFGITCNLLPFAKTIPPFEQLLLADEFEPWRKLQ